MLTPAFKLEQDDEYLFVKIEAPFAKISETEFFIDDTEFKFYSSPYYLRLNLPGCIVEDGREKAEYDSDKGTFNVRVAKETRGEHFDGLDMLTKLLAPKGQRSAASPGIEVIAESSYADGQCAEISEIDDDFDWQIEQVPYHNEDTVSLDVPKYGFACQRRCVFRRLQSELCGVVDLKDPDAIPEFERRTLRQAEEDSKFNEDHYLADLYQSDEIQQFINYDAVWQKQTRLKQDSNNSFSQTDLTDEEKTKMRDFPRREYSLDKTVTTHVYLGLVDLLFAYAYNHRTTEGENTVESGWTICKLSSTLSWLQRFYSLKDVCVACVRRTLCYPLYRNWQLAQAVLEDAHKILRLGRRQVLQCLLEIHTILSATESHYILNDLYITDYCVWIQHASDKHLDSLATELSKVAMGCQRLPWVIEYSSEITEDVMYAQVTIQKDDMGFDLIAVENIAKLIYTEDEVSSVTHSLAGLHVKDSTTINAETCDSDDDTNSESDYISSESDDTNAESDDTTSESDDESCSESNNTDSRTNDCLKTKPPIDDHVNFVELDSELCHAKIYTSSDD